MRKTLLSSSGRKRSTKKIPTKQNFFRTQLGIATIGALLCLGVALRLANCSNVSSRTPDEIVYTNQAKLLLQRGQAGLTSLIAEYQRNPAARLFPPPTRLGYLWPLAAAMQLTGGRDESVGASLSCAASIGSLFIVALIGVRFFPSWATFFAVLFFAVSPMELAVSQRAWTDALVEFLGVSLVYVAAEITRDSARRIWYLLFVALGSLGIAVKESGLVGYGLCAIWLLWVLLIERREWVNGAILMAGGLAGLTITIAWLAISTGGVSLFAKIVTDIPSSNAANQYAIEYQSGPGYLLLRALEIMSPVAAVLGLVGCGVLLFSVRKQSLLHLSAEAANWQVVRWITLFTLAYLALPMVLPHWLNLRYISVLFGPFYLIAGVGFWYCASLCHNWLKIFDRKLFAGLVIVAASIGAVADYDRFQRIVVRDALKDLSIKNVLDADKRN
jgi:4-amino-4-deoxy-L-arabinose transferase-like glycosyltransferase